MTAFRELYVPAGAGSNFLAKSCLWNNSLSHTEAEDRNEYYCCRAKVMPEIEEGYKFSVVDKDLQTETKIIRPILIELDNYINLEFQKNDDLAKVHNNKKARKTLLEDLDLFSTHLLVEGINHDLFWYITSYSHFCNFIDKELLPKSIQKILIQVEDYFIKCRERFYAECHTNNLSIYKIGHHHPNNEISSKLTLPVNFKSLAIELDAEMDAFCRKLQELKADYSGDREELGRFSHSEDFCILEDSTEELFINKTARLADDKISYRKIFFNNDETELRKIYEFFDNVAYFDNNISSIMKDCKDYHSKNMKLLKSYTPKLWSILAND